MESLPLASSNVLPYLMINKIHHHRYLYHHHYHHHHHHHALKCSSNNELGNNKMTYWDDTVSE